jgi:hypothetical protein
MVVAALWPYIVYKGKYFIPTDSNDDILTSTSGNYSTWPEKSTRTGYAHLANKSAGRACFSRIFLS